MNQPKDRDYVLGTHDQELQRLGVQHRAWRPVVLKCWKDAGIQREHRVLDVGAGPGYATVDLAKIVGLGGRIVAVERSANFINAIKRLVSAESLSNVEVYELDLMKDELPSGPFDFTWCRWVLCFLSNPELLIQKIASVLGKRGRAIFHEYGHYTTWKFFPRRESLEDFRRHVIASWRESGGEPDTGPLLSRWLVVNGFKLCSVAPRIFCVRPSDYMWQWPAQFIHVHLDRLRELGRIDGAFAERVRAELAGAEKEENSFMLTPLVLEIVAEKA
jgi:SAM-dependent methyltransferase